MSSAILQDHGEPAAWERLLLDLHQELGLMNFIYDGKTGRTWGESLYTLVRVAAGIRGPLSSQRHWLTTLNEVSGL